MLLALIEGLDSLPLVLTVAFGVHMIAGFQTGRRWMMQGGTSVALRFGEAALLFFIIIWLNLVKCVCEIFERLLGDEDFWLKVQHMKYMMPQLDCKARRKSWQRKSSTELNRT